MHHEKAPATGAFFCRIAAPIFSACTKGQYGGDTGRFGTVRGGGQASLGNAGAGAVPEPATLALLPLPLPLRLAGMVGARRRQVV